MGEINVGKSLKLIIILCIGLTFFACSSDGQENTPIEITLDTIAQEYDSIVGENNILYRMDTEYTNEEGSYITFSLQSIHYYDEYLVNNGDKIKNVIVIENGLPIEENIKMVKDVAYFMAVGQEGNEIILGDIYTQNGKEFAEIIFSAEKIEETINIRFVIMGGFDSKTNNHSKIIFEVE